MNKQILAIGSHPDDIELGCGGALAQHIAAGDTVTLLVITNGSSGGGPVEQRLAEQQRAVETLGAHLLIWGDLPDTEVSLHERKLVHLIELAIAQHGRDLIYTHSQFDTHQDHRSVAMASLGAARNHRAVLTYAAPSSLVSFTPNVFVDITDTLEKKVAALNCHASQVAHSEMVNADRVRNTAGFRGHEARLGHAGMGEAFEAVRFVMPIE